MTKEEADKLVAKADSLKDNPEYIYGTILSDTNKSGIREYSDKITSV